MGVFINKGEHPDVFKNNASINEPNQGYLRKDYLSELIKEQKEANSLINHSFDDLKNLYQQQENIQSNQMGEIGKQLNALKNSHLQHEKFEIHVMEWLKKIDENNMKLQVMLENEGLFKQEIVDQIISVGQSNQEIVNQLGEFESSNEQLALKIKEQLEMQYQLSDLISKQEDTQSEVKSRLDNQDALTEKILRQVNHIRAILFERTNDLAEKIENGYNRTSSYVHKLITGTENPRTVLMMNPKKGEQKKSDENSNNAKEGY